VIADEFESNQAILRKIESVGGGYVWEPEIFAVTMLDIPIDECLAKLVCKLRGVRQIAINCRNISFSALLEISDIPGLQVLVVSELHIMEQEYGTLLASCPEVVVVGCS